MARKKNSVPASAAADRVVEHWTSRLMPLTAAPLACAGEAAAIAVMHHYLGGPVYTSLTSLTGAGASAYAFHAAGGHRHHLRALATVSGIAGTVAATVGMAGGLGIEAGPYAFGSAALSILWAIRHAMKAADEGSGHPLGQLGEAIGAEKHHLFNIKRSGKGVVTATVQARDGATIDQLQPGMAALQAAAGVPRGGAVLTTDDDDASIGYLQITVADLLKMTIEWPGIEPAKIGALCTDPIPLGVYADGEPFEGTPLTSDGDVEHDLIVGVTGSGKSEYCLVYMGTQCTRRQVSGIGIDCSKGLATFGPIAHGLTRNGLLITKTRDAKRLLQALSGPVFKARMAYLTSEGMSKWAAVTPRGTKTKINFLEVWIEEGADLADGETYAEMCRRVRSAGIKIHTSLQRAAWDDMATKARAMHGGGIAFGCRDSGDAEFALPEDVIDAGAAPTWRNRKPGYHICCALGADPERWTTRMRGYYPHDRQRLAAAVDAAADVVDPMDEITAAALGDLWTKRTVYTEPVGVAVTAGTAAPVAAAPAPAAVPAQGPAAATAVLERTAVQTDAAGNEDADDDEDEISEEELRAMMTEKDLDELAEAAEEVDEALARARREAIDEAIGGDEDVDDDFDDGPADFNEEPKDLDLDLDFGDDEDEEGGKASPEAAKKALYDQLQQWLDDGKTSFAPKDLYGLLDRLHRGRRWFYHVRDELLDAGVIAEGDDIGEYDIVSSPLAAAGTGDL